MHIRINTIIAAGCLISMQPAAADIIELKDGGKIEGTIIREDGEDYVVEVAISGTIRDEKRIAKADVKLIDRKGEDEKAFEAIGVPEPTPDLVEKEAYEEWLSRLEGFLREYPDSPKAEDAKRLLDVLGSEHAVIAAGGIKFGGKLVSAEDYDANAYEYDSKIAGKRIRDAVARRDFLSSLRMYSGYAGRFGQSESSRGLDALMLQVLGTYKASLDDSLASLERRLEKRQSGLASMAPEDRVKSERALAEQMAAIQKRYEKEKAAGEKWVTPESFHKESMDEALRAVNSEISKLRAQRESESPEMALAETYRVAWGKLSKINAEEKGMVAVVILENGGDAEVPEDEGDAVEETVEERKLAVQAQEERKKTLGAEKKKILEEAKASGLPEHYLAKLRAHAGLDGN